MLASDGRRPQDLAARALAADGSLRLDPGNEAGDEFPPMLLREMLPAEQQVPRVWRSSTPQDSTSELNWAMVEVLVGAA